jgi:hypothetical protein
VPGEPAQPIGTLALAISMPAATLMVLDYHWARFILNSQVRWLVWGRFGVIGLVDRWFGGSRSFVGGVLAVASTGRGGYLT